MGELKFVGGNPCLDFVNTVGEWTGPGRFRREKLHSYDDLLRWAVPAGVLSPAQAKRLGAYAIRHPREAADSLARARELRYVLHRILGAVAMGRRPQGRDMKAFREQLSAAREHEELRPRARGFAWVWREDAGATDQIPWAVARSAAALLTSDDLAALRQCARRECGWMFLDTSRNHSRRWCDMRDCGNLEKVKRFRQRRRQQ
jgi:predicted RNA-binding Zn ribbon-like protein